MAESIEQLSFGLTVTELAEQERALSSLRASAGTVLAAASVAGSFLAARAGHRPFDTWGLLATVSFVLCVGSAVWVLLPHEFTFAFSGQDVLTERDHGGLPNVSAAHRAAITWIAPHLQANRGKLAGLAAWLTLSCVLLAAEVVLWSLSLAE